MEIGTPRAVENWLVGKITLAYALGALLFLAGAFAIEAMSGRGLEDAVFALATRPSGKGDDSVDRMKIRGALDKLPAILTKLGIALLGVAGLARAIRLIEPAAVTREAVGSAETDGRRGPARAVDWAIPLALATLVFAQVAPAMGRPLVGDELENYQQHLTLPLAGMLTTMGGANNQLGFSILAWASIRLFGDSPASVRLPAILGAMLLPAVAYRFGSKDFGRAGATVMALLLALWPDIAMAGMQGRSYSLLMLCAIAHLHYFRRFVTAPDRRSGALFAATLAAACTLHLWSVIVAAAELVFLGVLKVAARFRPGFVAIRAPLRVEAFLLYMTLGGLAAATIQVGILPKFMFILTQKAPAPVDAGAVLSSMAECLRGASFDSGAASESYRHFWGLNALRTAINFVALVGLLACAWEARKDPDARFPLVFFAIAASTFFLVVYVQKPVYLYARFFAVLPMILAWAGARGWSLLLDARPNSGAVADARAIPA